MTSLPSWNDGSLDADQVKFMENDMCIVVDTEDNPICSGSKVDCHLMEHIRGPEKRLHRAFSVFLFDADFKLLLQQRADEKITFPKAWTNTVCSHPLTNEQNDETNGVDGVKIAAQRKLGHELNIPAAEVPLENFRFLTKIWYEAGSDETWGEHEIDYVLFIQVPNVTFEPNPNEVQATRYVTREEAAEIVAQAERGDIAISPWFGLIFEHYLSDWWEKFAKGENIPEDHSVHKLE
jgi:isopentenyl-diphosphate Delta-isomerase